MYKMIFEYRIKQIWQYRISLFSSIPLYFIKGLLSISILMAFNILSKPNGHSLINYIWIQTCFSPFLSSWIIDRELNNMIKTGDISYEYLKPVDLYWSWFTRLISQRFFEGMLSSLPILLIIGILPQTFKMQIDFISIKTIFFIIIILLALILNTTLSLLVYISVFHTLSITGSLLIFGSIMEFCGGMVIPFTLFPNMLQRIFTFLPFKYGAAYPLEIISTSYKHTPNYILGISIQLIWILIVIIIGKYWLKRNLTRIVVQGG